MGTQRGFSLVELIITVALATLVLSIGVPSFQNLSHANHAEAHQQEFLSAVKLARQIALEHGRYSEICPRDTSRTTSQTALCDQTASGAWENGWVIMMNDTAIMSNRHQSDGTVFTLTDSSTTIKLIRFSPTGTLRKPTCVDFKIEADSEVRLASINLAGHIQLGQSRC